ncbi:hypothetical protein R51_31180 [Bacillus safensis]|nr:hypothetical protein R51_31180 [Bacillus safensis]
MIKRDFFTITESDIDLSLSHLDDAKGRLLGFFNKWCPLMIVEKLYEVSSQIIEYSVYSF